MRAALRIVQNRRGPPDEKCRRLRSRREARTRSCWVQISSAGVTRYLRSDLKAAFARRGATLTKSSHVFDEPVAQHVMALMLGWARRLPAARDIQRGQRNWPMAEIRRQSVLLNGQTAVLFGFGSIAVRLAAMLQPFEMKVIGVRRAVRGDEGVEMLTIDDARLPQVLGTADHVVNLLPASESTCKLFDHKLFAACRPGARFYNAG